MWIKGRTDGQTDRQIYTYIYIYIDMPKLIVAFRKFANVPNICLQSETV